MRAPVTFGFLAALALLTPARSASAADYFYIIIFGSESDPKQLRFCHTFATFVRATGEGADPSNFALTSHTISWMPRNIDVRVRRIRPEPGVNVDFDTTMRIVTGDGETVTMWGPYLITAEVYNRSVAEYNLLNSGQELYRAVDGPINNKVTDCIHAVTAADPQFGRLRYPLDRVGKPASAYIAQQVVRRSQFDQTQFDNSWLIRRLGLDRYPLEYVSNRESPALHHYDAQSLRSMARTLHPSEIAKKHDD